MLVREVIYYHHMQSSQYLWDDAPSYNEEDLAKIEASLAMSNGPPPGSSASTPSLDTSTSASSISTSSLGKRKAESAEAPAMPRKLKPVKPVEDPDNPLGPEHGMRSVPELSGSPEDHPVIIVCDCSFVWPSCC